MQHAQILMEILNVLVIVDTLGMVSIAVVNLFIFYFQISLSKYTVYKSVEFGICFSLDINECLSEPCDSNATCLNTDGSFECSCNTGYSGNGFKCNGKFAHIYL